MSELLNNMSKKSFPPPPKKNPSEKLFCLEKIVLYANINFKCDVIYCIGALTSPFCKIVKKLMCAKNFNQIFVKLGRAEKKHNFFYFWSELALNQN